MSQSTLLVLVIGIVVVLIVIGLIAAMTGRRGMRLRSLPDESRDRYARSWQAIESRFIEEPRAAVQEADRVVVMILSERGATLEGHKRMPDELRRARDAAASDEGRQGTEGMRRAMVHYKHMVDDAVGTARMKRDDYRREVAS
ncbi:MAG: hypothetical protein E6I72_07145 [Chloroflexi bacterium]|nr:MAG: hypothetical protein E6I72_07145 [Chloroflexota bacterium]